MKYNKQVYLGYDQNGKQIRRWFHADTKADLKRKIEEYKAEMTPNMSDITFGKYAEKWFQASKSTKSKQTQDAARTHLKKCASLDHYPVRKITHSQLQLIVNESWDKPHAAKGVADVLRQVFQMAQNDGIIRVNPALGLERPKLIPPQRELMTDGEIDALKQMELNDSDRLFVDILLTFGLRPAEALALEKSDFDLKNKTLHITKSLELTNDNKSRVKGTKTEVCRDLPLPDVMVKRVKKLPDGYLFTKADGNLYTKSAYKRLQQRVFGDSGRTFYDLRHYRATSWYYLCQKGVISTKAAAKLLGHSELIFLKTYSHLDPSKERLDKIYENPKKKKTKKRSKKCEKSVRN